ncbi:MAG TPA: hypothetical protein VGF39_00745 [Stellaceae bacterium]
MQFVHVYTSCGWIVVASDVMHYYENMETDRPFTGAIQCRRHARAYDALRAHAPTPHHIIPGHDPLVMRQSAAAAGTLRHRGSSGRNTEKGLK